jgi:hypothetical protein
MTKEINLENLEVYKNNPEILKDITYLKENLKMLHISGMKFKDFPEEVRKNPFFALEYFSTIVTDKKEYKHIPLELLKEQFFVSACLQKNPDIYLLADSSCHTEYAFLTLRKQQKASFLKYAKESDLNNKEFCMEALNDAFTNFRYIPENFRSDHSIIMKTLKESIYSSDNYDRAEEVIKHIPQKILEDNNFVGEMLDCNKYVFNFLPVEYRKDTGIAEEMVCRDTSLFSAVDISLKQNKEFVEKLFDFQERHKKNYNFRRIEKFSESQILKNLDETFLDRDFCEKHAKGFRKVFTEMDKKVRSNLELIRCLYVYDPKEDSNSELYSAKFLSKIKNEELVEIMKNYIREAPKNMSYKEIQPHMLKLIDSYVMQKELQSTLPENETKVKRMKI